MVEGTSWTLTSTLLALEHIYTCTQAYTHLLIKINNNVSNVSYIYICIYVKDVGDNAKCFSYKCDNLH